MKFSKLLKKFVLSFAFLFTISIFAFSPEVEAEKLNFINELNNKKNDPSYALSKKIMKKMDELKRIIIFPENVNQDEIILSHIEDMYFLTHTPHFIHKHILISTFAHDNDIRIRYDEEKDDFFFHTKESVKEKREKWIKDPDIVYELDFFALREKRKVEETEPAHPRFIMVERPIDIHPTFQREPDGFYYLEIVTGSRDSKPTSSGNHNWIRLIDADGKVYSIGVHPKTSITGMNAYAKYPLRFFNSDIYEWIDQRVFYTHTFPILKEEFEEIMSDILIDFRKNASYEFEMDYSAFDYNCCDWIVDKISKYVTIDRDEMSCDLYATMTVDLFDYYRKDMPESARFFVDPLITLFKYEFHVFRLFRAAYCGGFETNPENKYSKCFLNKPFLFYFDLDMHKALHPYLFEEYFQNHEKELLEERSKIINDFK